MKILIRIIVMSLSVLPVPTHEMSSDMTDGAMDELHKLEKRLIDLTRFSPCGNLNVNVDHRKSLGSSYEYTQDVPDADTDFNAFPNPGKYAFEVQLPNTDTDDESKVDTNVDYESPLNISIDHKPHMNTDIDDDPYLDKNAMDPAEIYQHLSDEDHQDKVLGGRYAVRGETPWIVNINYRGRHRCGGAILNEFFIITSAHCLAGISASYVEVVVGDYARSRYDVGEQTFGIEKFILYENYTFSNAGSEYDIALMKIKGNRGVHFNRYISALCLPNNDPTPPIGTQFYFSGWGKMDTDSKHLADVLKTTEMPLITKESCKPIYDIGDLAPDMFCAGKIDGDYDLCPGDSGGPLYYKVKDSYVLYGLAESSSGCAMPNLPVVFTNVSMYVPWILEKIRQNSNTQYQSRIPNRYRWWGFLTFSLNY